MTVFKAWGKATSLLLALLIACSLLTACSLKSNIEVEGKQQDFAAMSLDELEEYVTVGEYKNVSIALNGKTKQDAVWDAVLKNANVNEYPQEHVYYYIDQLEGQYRYYASQAGVSYKEILEQLGESDATILQDAKAMAKKDVVYAIIVKKEAISLSDGEKQAYFDKYVDKYVETYGYGKEHVKANMSELIYDSMLYDKTTEFLILNNTFSK